MRYARGVLALTLLVLWLPPHLPATAALVAPRAPHPPAPWRYLSPAEGAHLRALVAADLRRPQAVADGYTAQLVEQRLHATFTPVGLTVQPSGGVGWQWALSVLGWGRDDTFAAWPAAAPVVAEDRVRYARGAVEEWYLLRPAGVEQGFTLHERLEGVGPLRVVLRVETALEGETESATGAVWRDAAGAAVLTYRGLRAWDAGGRGLQAWLEVGGDELALVVEDAGARYPVTIDPLVQQAKLVASDGAAGDNFGTSVALSGDGNTALVGALGSNSGQGAAYVFVRSGTAWTQQAKLTAGDGAAGDNFGTSVALSGDGNTALVGALGADISGNADQGAAYVFVRSGTSWSQQEKLVAGSEGAASDWFGYSVALSSDGNTALVGVPLADIAFNSAQGAAYVFGRVGTTWTRQQKLTASDGAALDQFGTSVALSGDGNTALVGAAKADVGSNADQGAAYVFTRSGPALAQQAKLTASDGAAFDQFGTSVALSGDGNTALVGAAKADVGSNADQGAAYVFGRSGVTWSQQQKLVASDGAFGAFSNWFGSSVGLSGNSNTALIGAPFAAIGDKYNQGAAYVFVPAPTPTSTATSTATPTPACTPRPRVALTVTPTGDGRLQVVITANTNPGAAPPNAVQAIQFTALDNATLQIPAQPGVPTAVTVTSPMTVTLTSAVSSVTLFVSRVAAGLASTVQAVVTDACGPWPTFFGGGATAF